MSQTLKPPVIIAAIVAVVLVVIWIGYKALGPSHPPERTDAAYKQYMAGVRASQAQQQSGAPSHP